MSSDSKYKILWHGNFLDGKLTFLLSNDQLVTCSQLREINKEVVIEYIVVSEDVNISGYLHLPLDVSLNDPVVYSKVMEIIGDQYIQCVTSQQVESIRNGYKLH